MENTKQNIQERNRQKLRTILADFINNVDEMLEASFPIRENIENPDEVRKIGDEMYHAWDMNYIPRSTKALGVNPSTVQNKMDEVTMISRFGSSHESEVRKAIEDAIQRRYGIEIRIDVTKHLNLISF